MKAEVVEIEKPVTIINLELDVDDAERLIEALDGLPGISDIRNAIIDAYEKMGYTG